MTAIISENSISIYLLSTFAFSITNVMWLCCCSCALIVASLPLFFGGDRFFFVFFFSPDAFVSTRAELIDFSSFFSISMTQLLGQMIQIFKRLHIIMYSSCWVLWYSRTTDPFSSCRWPVRSYIILYIPQLCARLPFFDANEMLDEKASLVFLMRFIH